MPKGHAKRGYQATEVKLHKLLTWALNVGKREASVFGCFTTDAGLPGNLVTTEYNGVLVTETSAYSGADSEFFPCIAWHPDFPVKRAVA